MGQYLDSTYEILQKLGSGGGGNVYLAEHKRLRKRVALKADKRNAATEETYLRRETDILKNLNHPFIPRVYDYFIEDGISYTVMDYIEGYSLDRPLRDGLVYPQPDVIRIAVEMLSALHYLHTIPRGEGRIGYLHGDIKPANVMRRPDGNIVLIDFNIALSLGDEDAVGVSPGYASPEHYGIDYSTQGLETMSYRTGFGRKGENPVSRRTGTGPASTSASGNRGSRSVGRGSPSVYRDDGSSQSRNGSIYNNSSNQTGSGSIYNNSSGQTGNGSAYSSSSGQPGNGSVYNSSFSGSGYSSSRRVYPDVRSDIYGVGATLYHLLSGVRPARDARAVTPLTGTGQLRMQQIAGQVAPLSSVRFSPEIVRIITKSMQVNPDLRYQSSWEMLQDFLQIREHDPRTKRLKRLSRGILTAASVLLLAGVLASFTGLRRMQIRDDRLKLTEYARNACEEGDLDRAVSYMKQVYAKGLPLLDSTQDAQSQEVLTEVMGIYDLEDAYRPLGAIEAPAEPQKVALSPDAETLAVMHTGGLSLYRTGDRSLIGTLEIEPTALADVEYADNDTILYAGKSGITAYSISSEAVLWTGDPCTEISLSGDRAKAAAVYKEESHAAVYDVAGGRKTGSFDFRNKKRTARRNDTFINPENELFALNEDGTRLAVSFDDGSLYILDASTPESGSTGGNSIHASSQDGFCLFESGSGYRHFEGNFAGRYLSFSAMSDDETVFGIIDTSVDRQTVGTKTEYYMSTYTDGDNICVCDGNYLVRLDPETGDQTPLTDTSHNIRRFCCSDGNTMISTGREIEIYDAQLHRIGFFQKSAVCDRIDISGEIAVAGSSGSTIINLLKYDKADPEKKIGTYDSSYKHDETRLHSDNTRFMLFSNLGFRIYDRNGSLLTEHSFTEEEIEPGAMYDQQYVRESGRDYLKVFFYDGSIDVYDGSTGSFLRTEYGAEPDIDLDAVYETDSFTIDVPLHGKTTVFDKKTGKQLAQIEEEAYVTYATEIEEGIVLQYVTTDAVYYGILLDRSGRPIARLPGLRDIKDHTFLFDYGNGAIYQTGVLGLNDLLDILDR